MTDTLQQLLSMHEPQSQIDSPIGQEVMEQKGTTERHVVIESPGPFQKLALSGDGNTLVAIARNTLCVFNTRNRERIGRFIFDRNVRHIAVDFDGRTIVATDSTNAVFAIDIPFSVQQRIATFEVDITALAINDAGTTIALGNANENIEYLDMGDFESIGIVECEFIPTKLIFRDADDLVIACTSQSLALFRLSTLEYLTRYGEGQQYVDPNDLTEVPLITEATGGIAIFDSSTGERRFMPIRSSQAFDATVDASRIVSANCAVVSIWDSSRATEIRSFDTYIRQISDVKICNEGRSVFACGIDETIEEFSTDGERLVTYADLYCPIMAAATTHDDRTLVVADQAGIVAVYDLVTGEVKRFHLHACNISKMHVDGSLVATGSHDGVAKVFNLDTSTELFKVSFASQPVQAVTLDADRYLVAGNRLGQVHMYDIKTGDFVREYHGNSGPVRSLSISPCRRYLMSTNANSEVLIFDFDSGKLINKLQAIGMVYSGCFDQTGEFVYFGDSLGRIVEAHTTTSTIRRSWKIHDGDVRSVCVQSDLLCSTGIRGKAHILDLISGATYLDCPLTTQPFHRVAFMNRSRTRLVTGGQDGRLMFRDVNDGSIIGELHHLANGFLWLAHGTDLVYGSEACFWTNQEDMIQVLYRVGGVETPVPRSAKKYNDYLRRNNNMDKTMSQIGMTADARGKQVLSSTALCHDQLASWEGVALLEQLNV